jgi:hypothetical protein
MVEEAHRWIQASNVIPMFPTHADQVVVSLTNGTLLISPSYLEHSVSPSMSDEERISISFNVMFSSFAETPSKPLW